MIQIGFKMAIDKSIFYDFFEYRLDVENQQLLRNGQTVQLTHKAFQILLLLVQNSGQTTKKEDIFSELWSDSFVEDGNLTQHVYVLRKALGQTPTGDSYIETVPRQGYRFTLLPEQISIVKIPAQPDEPQPNEEKKEVEAQPNKLEGFDIEPPIIDRQQIINDKPAEFARKKTSASAKDEKIFSRPFLIAAILLLSIGLVVFGFYYFEVQPEKEQIVSAPIQSIAVLPFRPIGEEAGREKLGLGMADAVITRLSNLKSLVVRPTSAVFSYTDQTGVEGVDAGRRLGVDAILEGTVQADGQRVRISVQLVRVANGKPLWAETFQEEMSDIFAVQDSISAKVATALSMNLTKQQEQMLAQRSTNSPEAFQAYQLGLYFWNKRSKADLEKAIGYFQKATDYDPNYAYAYAGLADCYSSLAYFGFEDTAVMIEKARAAAEKAIAQNNLLGDGYAALALAEIADNNFGKAQQLIERALSLSPYNATARQRYGHLLIFARNLDEGARQMRLAQEYDPLSPTNNKALCNALVYQRNFSEAVGFCEKSVELSPNTPGSRSSLAHAYFHAGRFEEAIEQMELEKKSGSGYISTEASLAFFYAKLGRRDEAESIYRNLMANAKNDLWLPLILAPSAYSLGKREEALELFGKAVETIKIKPEIATIINYSPSFDDMRNDRQFAALIPER